MYFFFRYKVYFMLMYLFLIIVVFCCSLQRVPHKLRSLWYCYFYRLEKIGVFVFVSKMGRVPDCNTAKQYISFIIICPHFWDNIRLFFLLNAWLQLTDDSTNYLSIDNLCSISITHIHKPNSLTWKSMKSRVQISGRHTGHIFLCAVWTHATHEHDISLRARAKNALFHS